MFLFRWFGSSLAAKIEAGFNEAGLFVAAGIFVALAVLAFLYLPAIAARFKTAVVVACLWAASLCVFGEVEYRRARALDASAELQRMIETQRAELAEREREAKAAHAIAERERTRADQADAERNDTNGRVADYVEELKKAKDACALGDSDLRRMQQFRRHDPGRVPPVPPRRAPDLRGSRSVPLVHQG